MDRNKTILYAVLLLGLYLLGVPLLVVALLGVLYVVGTAFKDRLWKKIDKFFDSQKAIPKEPGWLRWAIVFAVVLLAYYAIKLIIYYILGLAGFDVEGEMLRAMNATRGP